MTNREFVDTIIDYYTVSRNLSIKIEGYNVWRGVSHSISSNAEDLFAKLMIEKINDKDLEFIVDKTMSYNLPGQKSVQFRPDLAIVKNGIMTHVLT
jgi:hypothetical protein